MPFCTQCGVEVASTAAFCQGCGHRQPLTAAPPRATGEEWLNGINPKSAATLCYVPFVGWIGALVFLSSQRFRNDGSVRFHAFQGLYLAIFWLLLDIALLPFFGLGGVIMRRSIGATLRIAVLAGWVYMLVKTSAGETIHLPVIGEIAERSATEQRA